LLVVGLGITWILDGLEVTLMGAIAAVLQHPDVMNFSAAEIGFISSCYLAGAVVGSLLFGYLTDRFGRRMFFFVSLTLYLLGVGATAFAWNVASFAVFRFATGAGIGGEYSAVNSAIDELIPARVRGRIDLFINGSFWLGAAGGAASTLLILNPAIFPPNFGWRLGFAIGPVIGIIIIYLRRFIPESPRWLLTHGRLDEAESVVREVENTVAAQAGRPLPDPPFERLLAVYSDTRFGLTAVLKTIVTKYRSRSILGLALMVSQAFVYNAIFFTYALVLSRYYSVPASMTGIYLFPFAITNFLGPLLLGPLFDTLGRRQMIAFTYATSALLLVITGWLFTHSLLTTFSQVALWTLLFFFASPAASSAYLTVSELFPLEMRALAIALFYSAGTAVGGIAAPWLFGKLIDAGSREYLFYGYSFAAALMFGASLLAIFLGVAAERTSLEEVATPLSSLG
jgi:MFS family permease